MSRRGDHGQAVVEFALVLPVVCTLLLGVVQVGLVVRSQLAVQVAARAAARAAAVAAEPVRAAQDAALGSVRLRPLAVEVRIGTVQADAAPDSPSSSTRLAVVTATVLYADPTDVPVIGLLVPPIELRARVTMAIEPP